jgi:hypothetical protein
MTEPTRKRVLLFRGKLQLGDGLGDTLLKLVRHPFATPLGDDDSQLDLEVKSLQTGRAVVEMMLDQNPSLLGELSIDVVVQKLYGLLATFTHV